MVPRTLNGFSQSTDGIVVTHALETDSINLQYHVSGFYTSIQCHRTTTTTNIFRYSLLYCLLQFVASENNYTTKNILVPHHVPHH